MNIYSSVAQEGIMARALIVGLIELGSLAIFSACVAVLTFAIAGDLGPDGGERIGVETEPGRGPRLERRGLRARAFPDRRCQGLHRHSRVRILSRGGFTSAHLAGPASAG